MCMGVIFMGVKGTNYRCSLLNCLQAKAVAYESSATFFCISAASLTSKYVSIRLMPVYKLINNGSVWGLAQLATGNRITGHGVIRGLCFPVW